MALKNVLVNPRVSTIVLAQEDSQTLMLHGAFDSYRERYVYGHSIYEITAADSPYDLPIFFKLAAAQRHDSVLSVITLDEAIKFYPEFSFSNFTGDTAHDAYAVYSLLHHFNIDAIIPIKENNKGNPKHPAALTLTQEGIPVCIGEFPMINSGFCKDRCRIKWRCPLIAGKIPACAHASTCSQSPYGRVIYTKPSWDFRLFTRIPRGSPLWKTILAKRTSSERSFKRKKIDYKLENARVRSRSYWFIRSMLTAMCQHVDAWYSEFDSVIQIKKLIYSWRDTAT
ncbi:hypothetical protein KKB18_05935 [bacterium]|nr:hypothetical protein [Candidatus Micrarchaeota archaeon]MBU1626892.1 hypothetical protein [bacterium]